MIDLLPEIGKAGKAAVATAIECRNLSKKYRKGETEVVALDGLDLEVGEGEFLAVMGPSGSGKSTLLHLLAGLDTPTSGMVMAAGTEVSSLSQAERTRWRAANVGFVFQTFNLIPVLTACENVDLPLALKPLTRHERRLRVQTALELVALLDRADHYPHQLSQGQEQRVGIARALVSDPPILLADEPTGNLDAASADEVVHLFHLLASQFGKTVVMVTHDARMAEQAGRVVRLDKGRAAAGRPAGR
jgi:putative ABC transport system ATP-binding protein